MSRQQEPERRSERRRAWLIGLTLLCCYGFFYYPGGNDNVESRHAQIVALADHRTLVIDPYHHWTGDKAFHRGHYYSDKLIGPTLAAAPIYWLSRRLIATRLDDPRLSLMLALRVANLLTNAAPSALVIGLFYLFLAEFGLGAGLRAWLAFTWGLGTLALPYSTALFGHQFAAACVAGSFMLLRRQAQGLSPWGALGAGALAGLAAISDFMGVVVAALLGLYAIVLAARAGGRQAPSRISAFAAAALAVISLQLAANWASFGSPLTFAHAHHASYAARHSRGFFGIHRPDPVALYQLTLGPYRGLFFGSPVLLLALPGFLLLGRARRAEAALAAAAWLGVLLLHSGYEDWPAGTAYGPRYQAPLIPLLVYAVAAAAPRSPFALKGLASVSIALNLIVCAQNPFGIPVDVANPLAVALARFSVGDLQRGNLGMLLGLSGLWSLLPLAGVLAMLLYALSRVGGRELPARRAGS